MTAQQEFSKLSLKQHPLSAAFPSMPEAEIEALSMDIEKHGQREPGVTLDGMILDGWHRYLACHRAGKEFVSTEFVGDDPVSFVISRNLHRRHLTASQRAGCVVAALNWKPVGRPTEKGDAAAELSSKQLAEKAEVSERTIERAKSAHKAGLGEDVRSGRVTAERAAEIAKLPKAKREKALTQQPSKKDDPRDAEIKRLAAALEEANEKLSDLGDVAREQADKLTAFETTDPDDQQKEIQKLQKRIVRLEAEIERLTVARNDGQNKNNQLIRQVKLLQKNAR